jgi:hypothetical protein
MGSLTRRASPPRCIRPRLPASQGRPKPWPACAPWESPMPSGWRRLCRAETTAFGGTDPRGRCYPLPRRSVLRGPAAGTRLETGGRVILRKREYDDAAHVAAVGNARAGRFCSQYMRSGRRARQTRTAPLCAGHRLARRGARALHRIEDAPASITAARNAGIAALGVARYDDAALLQRTKPEL